ncbi:MAG: tetratricopeptide repeat protein [Synergistaceae bacterium]|jgi:tetratricopeptide (TPR) repeat protein|nr:tetratricopeptide repeat protein [Synergistaceae bacterium]
MSSSTWLVLTLTIDVLVYAAICFLKRKNGKRSGQRFEERWKSDDLARPVDFEPQSVSFRERHRYSIAAGVIVFFVAATVLFTYSHLRRNSYEVLMKNAETLYDRERYEESLKAYTEVSLIYPDRIDPFLGVARASERTGRIEDAIEAYKCVLDLEPFYDFTQNELPRASRATRKEDPGKEM